MSVGAGFGYQSELELRVAEAVRRQYNKLKIQTKAEIRQTIDRLLVGDFIVSELKMSYSHHHHPVLRPACVQHTNKTFGVNPKFFLSLSFPDISSLKWGK